MDRKDIIIILLSLIIIALLANNYMEDNTILYQTVNLTSTFSIDVPYSQSVTNTQLDEHLHLINDTQNDIQIYCFNTGGTSITGLLTEGTGFVTTREMYKLGAEQITLSNYTVYYNRKDNNYMAFFSNEHNDNVMIITHDNETMARMIESVNY